MILEIPINVLQKEADLDKINFPEYFMTQSRIRGDQKSIESAIKLIEVSKKPIIIAGNGIFYSNGSKQLTDFVEFTGIPTFTANAGRGTLPDDHELCFGNGRILDAGNQLYAFNNTDLAIILGSSLDYTFFFLKGPIFNPEMKVIQVDTEPVEIGKNGRPIDIGIIGHSSYILEDFLEVSKKLNHFQNNPYAGWVNELDINQKKFNKEVRNNTMHNTELVQPLDIIDTLNETLPRDSIVVSDGSNSMFWSTQFINTFLPGHNLIGPSGTYGPMGTGLGLALGAKVANPDKFVTLYTGDGSLGFDIMEISTAVRHKLPVLIIVHNDQAWGFCKATQNILYNDSCATELSMVHYEKVATALGGEGVLITKKEEIKPAIEKALNSNKVYVLNVMIDKTAVSPGANFLNTAHKTYKEFA